MIGVEQTEIALKAIRACNTKAHWEQFVLNHGPLLLSSTSQRLIGEAFKRLRNDPQSLYYSPQIWGHLIRGAIASCNTDLGVTMAAFSRKITSPVVAIPAAQIHLDAGKTQICRDFAHRSLRLSSISDFDRIQLELIVASSFAEEGKIDHSTRILQKIEPLIQNAAMTPLDRSEFLVRMGQLQYFMGQYHHAAKTFEMAAPLLLSIGEFESAAKAYFNAGACIQNSGTSDISKAGAYVEQCRTISEAHELWLTLSHCEVFYGVESYNKGLFVKARDHLKKAMSVIPNTDKTLRRVHVISLLSLTFFALGKYSSAIKLGKQTLELASQDVNDRLKIKYKALEAEIFWEEGLIQESFDLLKTTVKPLTSNGVKNLEELMTVTRYFHQMTSLGIEVMDHFEMDDSLSKNQPLWIEYKYIKTLNRSLGRHDEGLFLELKECLDLSAKAENLHFQALSSYGLVILSLQNRDVGKAKHYLPLFENAVTRLGETPLRAKLVAVYAGIAYQLGDFDRAVKQLSSIEKMTTVSWADRFAAQVCIATIRGESPRLHFWWQEYLVARFARSYFAPTIMFGDDRIVRISEYYEVRLDKHPGMADLLKYLIDGPQEGVSLSEIQSHVWKQSLNAQGWQQKIRNCVMRLRDLFPYTVAPLLIHQENLRFFSQAVQVVCQSDQALSMELRVRHMLNDGPLSSQQVADKLTVSLATAKRILRRLVDDHWIQSIKSGRHIVYEVSHKNSDHLRAGLFH